MIDVNLIASVIGLGGALGGVVAGRIFLFRYPFLGWAMYVTGAANLVLSFLNALRWLDYL